MGDMELTACVVLPTRVMPHTPPRCPVLTLCMVLRQGRILGVKTAWDNLKLRGEVSCYTMSGTGIGVCRCRTLQCDGTDIGYAATQWEQDDENEKPGYVASLCGMR